MFRNLDILEKMIGKLFRNHNVCSIQKDDSSMGVYMNKYKKYNLELKKSLGKKRGKLGSNHHKPSYYTYIILSGSKLKKLLKLLSTENPTGQGNKKQNFREI